MSKILFFGEPLIRITPFHNDKLSNNMNSQIYYGGSEINIAKNMSGFNIDTAIFTALPNNPIGDSFLDFMRESYIDTKHIQRCGERIGIYFLINGCGIRNSEVYYDRKFTSINDIDLSLIDMNQLFEGITHFHFSGITIAISSKVREILLVLLKEAKKRNITISLDLNLRTKMISIEDAKKYFSKFASYADYCFGIDPLMINDQDTTMFDRINATEQTIEKRMKDLCDTYHFKAIFHTLRYIDENEVNSYQAYAYTTKLYHSIEIKTKILERVGSGDAFVAGALYQIINNASTQNIIDFAVAAGSMKCTLSGDNMSQSEKAISALLQNHIEISR
ncbi:MAG: sugar kinase [Coprobacillus sp.]